MKQSKSERIREYREAHPDVTPTTIAKALHVDRRLVDAALKRNPKRGRPVIGKVQVCGVVTRALAEILWARMNGGQPDTLERALQYGLSRCKKCGDRFLDHPLPPNPWGCRFVPSDLL